MGLILKSLLLNRNFWFVVVLLASIWFAYSWAYDRGAASRDPEVAELTHKLSKAESIIDAHTQTVLNQKAAYDTALSLLRAEAAITAADLRAKLDQSIARERKWKETRNATVTKFITPKGDSACTVPAGFVRLHNLTAKGLDPGTSSEAASVPGGGPETADSPTTVKLSAVGATVADNYSECQSRLEVIEGWQMWYTRSLGTWRRAAEAASNYVAVTPLETMQ